MRWESEEILKVSGRRARLMSADVIIRKTEAKNKVAGVKAQVV